MLKHVDQLYLAPIFRRIFCPAIIDIQDYCSLASMLSCVVSSVATNVVPF